MPQIHCWELRHYVGRIWMTRRRVRFDTCIMRFALLKSSSWTSSNRHVTMCVSIYSTVGKNQCLLAQLKTKITTNSILWAVQKTTLTTIKFSKLRITVDRIFLNHLTIDNCCYCYTNIKDLSERRILSAGTPSPNWVVFYLQRHVRVRKQSCTR